MLKRTLLIASLVAFTGTAFAADVKPTPAKAPQKQAIEGKRTAPADKAEMEKKRTDFDERLKLTDEQKAQAKVIRENGAKEMEPITEKKKTTAAKIKAVKADTKLSEEAKAAKIKPLNQELRKLNMKAREIRVKNQQEFEAILTDKQKKELAKMKAEGKKDSKKKHGKKGKGVKGANGVNGGKKPHTYKK
jgi:Spy/CpxP family protein refolding chaperone